MDYQQLESTKYFIAKRALLVEGLETHLGNAGTYYRQIEALDRSARLSFTENGIVYPEEIKPAGLRAALDTELEFQLKQGDAPRDSFLAAMEAPRASITKIMAEAHDRILQDNPLGKENRR